MSEYDPEAEIAAEEIGADLAPVISGTPGKPRSGGTFRSLRNRNYRLWASGAFVSNIGTWMQRIAQDWLVLTELTQHSATAVGTVTALQFAPSILLLPWTGSAADRFDRRKLVFATQSAIVLFAFCLGLLTLLGWVRLWHVYIFALGLGCATAFDAPARNVFVSDLVGEEDLSNAVALNSSSFQAARMIGPAVAGLLIAAVGTGPAFLINAAATLCVLASIAMIRADELHLEAGGKRRPGGMGEALRYVRDRPDLMTIMAMLGIYGTCCLNFAIFNSTMAVQVFHVGADHFGLLTSCLAIGSMTGAILAARREQPQLSFIVTGCLVFAGTLGLAALMPNVWLFALLLVPVGIATQTVTTSSNGFVQLGTDRHMRGRVMALLMTILMGSATLGGPLAGWIVDQFGPRWAVGIGALSGLATAAIGLRHMARVKTATQA